MVTELTDKVKKQIVESQIKVLEETFIEFIKYNYSVIKTSLNKGISNYLPKKELLNADIDRELLNKMELRSTASRLIKASNTYFSFNTEISSTTKDKHLLEFYNFAEENIKGHGFNVIRNYGLKTHKLLQDYLEEKKLINSNNNS